MATFSFGESHLDNLGVLPSLTRGDASLVMMGQAHLLQPRRHPNPPSVRPLEPHSGGILDSADSGTRRLRCTGSTVDRVVRLDGSSPASRRRFDQPVWQYNPRRTLVGTVWWCSARDVDVGCPAEYRSVWRTGSTCDWIVWFDGDGTQAVSVWRFDLTLSGCSSSRSAAAGAATDEPVRRFDVDDNDGRQLALWTIANRRDRIPVWLKGARTTATTTSSDPETR